MHISSPDNSLQLSITENGIVQYALAYKGISLVQPSSVGMKLNRPEISLHEFEVLGHSKKTVDETWKPLFGEKSKINNTYNELTLNLKSKDQGIMVKVIFRVFNDGLGFRYEFPKQEGFQHFILGEELTEFNFGEDLRAFWIPGDYETNEYLYNTTRLSEIDALAASDKERDIALKEPIGKNFVQTPLLLQNKEGVYIHLHEAALVNYPVMQLELDQKNFKFTSHLVPDGVGNKAYLETGFKTPWRTLIISDRAEDILASDLILNLNEHSKIGDTSWIKPLKFIGVWWEMHVGKGTWPFEGGKHAANTENVKRYIDFAAKYGIDGVLVEGWNEGWEDWFGNWKEEVFDFVSPYPDYDIKALSTYAASKNVKLIMHHETSGSVTNYERRMESAFDFMKAHDIETVKTGYVGRIIPRGERHDSHWMNSHYIRVAEKAAEKQIMVISHESSRPTGLHRTYPNWMASEAARGNEFNNAPTLGITPEHETILAFTRLKGGPMDYTPGFFQFELNQFEPSRTTRVNTTIAKQAALFVVFYSPIQMIGDLPENLEKFPELLKFIVDIPMTWKESIAIEAKPGDYVVYARKDKNGVWYVAGISDEEAREVRLDFSFLEKGKKYQAQWVRDSAEASFDQNPGAHDQSITTVQNGKKLKVKMAKGGGFVMRIAP